MASNLETVKDPLSVRVMRLSQPRIPSSVWTTVDSLVRSALSSDPGDFQPELLASSSDHPTNLTLDEHLALQLPTQQGRVFAGETFRAYVDVVNLSATEAVREVRLKVELSNGVTESILYDNRCAPVNRLDSHQALDTTIQYPIETVGPHVLICQVFYSQLPHGLVALNEGTKTMRKTFRFQALSPFKIRHRLHFVPNRAFVEFSIENQSGMSLLLQQASVLGSPGVKSLRLDSPNEKLHYDGLVTLRSKDVYHILFSLEPFEKQDDVYLLKTLLTLGHLSLVWRLPTGGTGQLTSYSIDNIVQDPLPIEVQIKACPATVQVECPFTVEFQCINRTANWRTCSLHFLKDVLAPLYIQGETQKTLPPISPNNSQMYSATFIAIVPGLHPIRGVVLRNAIDGELLYKSNTLAKVLVF